MGLWHWFWKGFGEYAREAVSLSMPNSGSVLSLREGKNCEVFCCSLCNGSECEPDGHENDDEGRDAAEHGQLGALAPGGFIALDI